MEDIKYPIELEVITPLSVGAGNDNEWTRGIDYVQRDKKVYVLDIQKAVANGVDIERLTNLFLKYDEKGISQLLGNNLEKVSRYVFDAPVSTINSIKTFLRTQLFDKPVVSGSSLKGSIRSALFKYLRDNEKTNEEVFGNMKDGTDFMRFVRIADVEMPSTKLVNTKIFNLRKEGNSWFGGWKHGGTREGDSHTDGNYQPTGFNTLYECVVPGKKGLGSITLAGGVFDLMARYTQARISHAEKKSSLMSNGISHLFTIINDVTRTYLQKEKKFFETYPAERSDEIVDNIDYLISLIPDDGSCCLLKMSAGVGFHSITGDWIYSDYDDTGYWQKGRDAGKKMYKSRKTSEYNGHLQLMGFVKLRSLSNDELKQISQTLDQEHHDIAEQVLAPLRLKEAERQKAAEAERSRRMEAEKESKRRSEYLALVSQAKAFYDSSSWSEAITLLEQASSIAAGDKEHSQLMEQCIKAKETAEFLLSEKAAATERFSQPLADVIKGKTSAGNLIGTTIKWMKDKTFGEQEYQALVSEAKLLPSKEQKKLKSKRSDLLKAIGEELTNKFFKEVGQD
jgi:hypothetical protein